MSNTMCSTTMVKNGMPYIGLVLEQVIGIVDRSLVTLSVNSNDGTEKVILDLMKKYPGKIELTYEKVDKVGDLTEIRQQQLERVKEDWVLFLDDDDYWNRETLQAIKDQLSKDHIGYAIDMFQLTKDPILMYDARWIGRPFTKIYQNLPGMHFEFPYPRDLIYYFDQGIHWRDNSNVKVLSQYHFMHLSYLKNYSFRNEEWARTNKSFQFRYGEFRKLPDSYLEEAKKIYEYPNVR